MCVCVYFNLVNNYIVTLADISGSSNSSVPVYVNSPAPGHPGYASSSAPKHPGYACSSAPEHPGYMVSPHQN